MYKRETEERSPSHFCHEKAVSFTRSECVSVALGPAYTKETGHGNVTAISKKRHRFWAGNQLPDFQAHAGDAVCLLATSLCDSARGSNSSVLCL